MAEAVLEHITQADIDALLAQPVTPADVAQADLNLSELPAPRLAEVCEDYSGEIAAAGKKGVAAVVIAAEVFAGVYGKNPATETHSTPPSVVAQAQVATAVATENQHDAAVASGEKPMTEAELDALYATNNYTADMANNEGPAAVLPVADIPEGTTVGQATLIAVANNPELDPKEFAEGLPITNPQLIDKPKKGEDIYAQPIKHEEGEVLVMAGAMASSMGQFRKDIQSIAEAPQPDVPHAVPSEIPGLISPSNIGPVRVDGYHEMPPAPNGEYRFQEDKPYLHCASKPTIDVVYTWTAKMHKKFPNPEDQVEIGDLNGAVGHKSHKRGNDADLYSAGKTYFDMYEGDQEKTKIAFRELADTGGVDVIFYNDPEVIEDFNNYVKEHNLPGRMEWAENHDRHAHLRTRPEYALPIAMNCSPDLPPAPAHEKEALATQTTYVIGDSISAGLHQTGLEDMLQTKLGGQVMIDFDSGRSITRPGTDQHKSALDAIDGDQEFIKTANNIVVVLGTNPTDNPFAENLKTLVERLKSLSPDAAIYVVDIAATRSNTVEEWNARNKIIYDNASTLGYKVISRAKAIFGDGVDPTNLPAGRNIPGSGDNIHGAYDKLAAAITWTVGNERMPKQECNTGAELPGADNAEKVYHYLISKGLAPHQVAGIMGNMQSEAHFEPRQEEYAYSAPPHLSDEVPANVTSKGQPGYGIVQWTSPGRKDGLRAMASSQNLPASDLKVQLDYLWQELTTSYKSTLDRIKQAGSYEEATNIFLSEFEIPAHIDTTRPGRIENARQILERYGSLPVQNC